MAKGHGIINYLENSFKSKKMYFRLSGRCFCGLVAVVSKVSPILSWLKSVLMGQTLRSVITILGDENELLCCVRLK
jgi:hypothetical protein